jgi:high-affinity Fe2+/Pb2+ permease
MYIEVKTMIDFTAITNMLNQLVPVIINVAMLGAVLSIVFGFLIPMVRDMFK